jgi:uncharacterized membrane protein
MAAGRLFMTKVAPLRFILFVVVLIGGVAAGSLLWRPVHGTMLGFDAAAGLFLMSCAPLLNDGPGKMRDQSRRNDANRVVLLAITVVVTIAVLVTVGAVIMKAETLTMLDIVMIVATLALAWLFGNMVYAMHYAHMFYLKSKDSGGDAAGIDFPGTKQPDYWDFIYFAFTLGMTFQTSDCAISAPAIRRIAIGHCMAAFVFNLGVLAFTINALGS